MTARIKVCTGHRCGKSRLLGDIEELSKTAGCCSVSRSGCMGRCMSAPNLEVKLNGAVTEHRRVRRNELAEIVQEASGLAKEFRSSDLYTPAWQERLAKCLMAFTQKHGCILPRTLRAWPFASSSNTSPKSANLDAAVPLSDRINTWRIDKIDVVSTWSAIYRCSSLVPTENMLAPGRQTWHVTMFAKIGEDSQDMVEREYTPISTLKQWEQGTCELLVKIYPDGKMTSWLYTKKAGDELLFSNPKVTLQIPSLTAGAACATASSVVLIVGGTGITAALQVLERYRHDDLLDIPVTLMYSSRKSDVLMLQALEKWALDDSGTRQQRRKAILALTKPVDTASPPFPNASTPRIPPGEHTTACGALTVVDGRICEDLLFAELAALPTPIRIVVCGPEAMNIAINKMLVSSPIAPSLQITVLEA